MAPPQKNSSSLLKGVVFCIAAGGDASRLIPQLHRNQLAASEPSRARVPLWLRDHCMATMPFGPVSGTPVIDYILEMVRAFESQDDVQIPVAVITGPNTHAAIAKHVHAGRHWRHLNGQLIQQASTPVFHQDGSPIRWEDESPFQAPDGTAGCLDALRRSEFFRQRVEEGYEYVFVWYVNDIPSGETCRNVMSRLRQSELPLVWSTSGQGNDALNALAEASSPVQKQERILALEDAPGTFGFRVGGLDEVLGLVDVHGVVKDVPVVLSDKSFLQGVKREKFLTDAVRKAAVLHFRRHRDEYLDVKPGGKLFGHLQVEKVKTTERGRIFFCTDLVTGESVALDAAGETSESRANQHLQQLQDQMSKAQRLGANHIKVEAYIGERHPGDFLVDTYKIIDVKRGGMGVVYICMDLEVDRRVAVKTYTDEFRWSRPGAVRQFRNEVSQWTTLPAHPNVVQAERVEEIDGRLHIFLEFIDGGDLRERMKAWTMPAPEALQIGIQVCHGLALIHQHGMIHRDIKPENILLTRDGVAKVTDLGLVATLSDPEPKTAAGTPGYMPPEQRSAPNSITTAADIYALGVTLYELLTERRPELFGLPTRKRDPLLPSELRRILLACLAETPSDRPTASALADMLAEEHRRLAGVEYQPPAATHETNESQPDLRISRVYSLAALGRHEEALSLCDEMVRRDLTPQTAISAKASLLYDLRRFHECTRHCLEALAMPADARSELSGQIQSLLEMCEIQTGVRSGDAQIWAEQGGFLALSYGSSSLGLQYADVALKLDPDNASAWFVRGQMVYNLGRYEESIRCFRKAQRSKDTFTRRMAPGFIERSQAILDGKMLDRFRAEKLHATGKACLGRGDFVGAGDAFRRALELDRNHGPAMLGLGLALGELGQPRAAIEWLDRMAAIDEPDSTTYYHKGKNLQRLNRLSEALPCYDEVIRLSPNNANAWLRKGTCLLVLGRCKDAERCFRMALQLEPSDQAAQDGLSKIRSGLSSGKRDEIARQHTMELAGFWLSCAQEFVEQKQLEHAFACCRTALEVDSQSADAWHNAGFVLWMLGRHKAALEHCDRCLAVAPEHVHAWNIRGYTLTDLGRNSEALSSFERAISLDERYHQAWNGKGVCLRALQRFQEAMRCFDMAHHLRPDFDAALLNEGLTLADLGRHEDAVGRFDAVLALDASSAKAAKEKGGCLFKLGRADAACEAFAQAVRSDPRDGDAWENLGSCQMNIGMTSEAIKCFRRALAADPTRDKARRNLKRAERMASQLAGE